MRSMQRSTTVNAKDLCGFLKLLVVGFIVIYVLVAVFVFILVAATGRSVSLPLLGLAAASSSAGAFLTGSSSTFLALLLVAPLVFSLLLLDKLLDLLAALEVMALGAVDLAILLVGAVLLVGDRHLRGNLLAGVTSFGFLGATTVAGLLNN